MPSCRLLVDRWKRQRKVLNDDDRSQSHFRRQERACFCSFPCSMCRAIWFYEEEKQHGPLPGLNFPGFRHPHCFCANPEFSSRVGLCNIGTLAEKALKGAESSTSSNLSRGRLPENAPVSLPRLDGTIGVHLPTDWPPSTKMSRRRCGSAGLEFRWTRWS